MVGMFALSAGSTTTADDNDGFSCHVDESAREAVRAEIEQVMLRDDAGKRLPLSASPLEIGRAVGPGIGLYFQLNRYLVIATIGAAVLCAPILLANSSVTVTQYFHSVSQALVGICGQCSGFPGACSICKACVGQSFHRMTRFDNTFARLACNSTNSSSSGLSRTQCEAMCERYSIACDKLYDYYPRCRGYRDVNGGTVKECISDLYGFLEYKTYFGYFGDEPPKTCDCDYNKLYNGDMCTPRCMSLEAPMFLSRSGELIYSDRYAVPVVTDRLCSGARELDRLSIPLITESSCSALRTFLQTDRRFLSLSEIPGERCLARMEVDRFEVKLRMCDSSKQCFGEICNGGAESATSRQLYEQEVNRLYQFCMSAGEAFREVVECERNRTLRVTCSEYLDSAFSRNYCADQCLKLAGSVKCADATLQCLGPDIDASHFAMGVDASPIGVGLDSIEDAKPQIVFSAVLVMVFFVVCDILINVKVTLAVKAHDVSVVSPSDYAVLIRHVPNDATIDELSSYCAQFGKVAGVHVLHASDNVPILAQAVLRSRYNVERMDRMMSMAKKVGTSIDSMALGQADASPAPHLASSPTKNHKSPRLRVVQDRILARQEIATTQLAAAQGQQSSRNSVVAALVVFETEEAQQTCVAALPGSFLSSLWKRGAKLRLRGNIPLVNRAPEPEDIMYHNIRFPFEKPTCHSSVRKVSLVLIYAVLVQTVVFIQVAAAASAARESTVKLSCEHFNTFYQASATCKASDSQGLAVLSAFVNYVVASLLADNIIKRSNTMKSYSNTERLSHVLDDTVFVHFAISCVIPLAFHSIFYAGGYAFKGMLVDVVTRQILVDSFMSIAKLIITNAVAQGRRILARRRATSVDALREGTTPSAYYPLSAYVELLKLLNLMLSWVVLVPWSVFAVIASMVGHGMIQRVLLLRLTKRPVPLSATIAESAAVAIRTKVLYGIFFTIIILATLNGSASESLELPDPKRGYSRMQITKSQMTYLSSLGDPESASVEEMPSFLIALLAAPLVVAFFALNQLVKESISLYSKLLALPTRLIMWIVTRNNKHSASATAAAPPDIQRFVSIYAPPKHSDWVHCIDYAVSHKIQTVTEALSAQKAIWRVPSTQIETNGMEGDNHHANVELTMPSPSDVVIPIINLQDGAQSGEFIGEEKVDEQSVEEIVVETSTTEAEFGRSEIESAGAVNLEQSAVSDTITSDSATTVPVSDSHVAAGTDDVVEELNESRQD